MERRTFLTGAFGLVVAAVGAGLGLSGANERDVVSHVTTSAVDPAAAVGPLMQAGIELHASPEGERVTGVHEGAELFSVDRAGALLVRLADGTRTIDELVGEASSVLGQALDPAEVASFYVTLGKAGYLQKTVLVNLVQQTA